MTVGIDIDNTIICYDSVLHSVASDLGLIDASMLVDKQTIRNAVRESHSDEVWQQLQVEIYGFSIDKACLTEGVWGFLMGLKSRKIPFQLVSHKTQFPNFGDVKVDLRKAAVRFLEKNKFFDSDGLALSMSDVFFLSTREEKVNQIAALGHTVFIDDLEEVFAESAFPVNVHKLLYSPKGVLCSLDGVETFSSFDAIGTHCFEVIKDELS